MSTVTIYGVAPSSYVRTARMACVEKGVEHELASIELGSPEHLALHPFGKVPVMKHEGVQLTETAAICRYIDEHFDGPALVPSGAVAKAKTEEWISLLNCYLYRDLVVDYLLPMVRKTADMPAIEAHVPTMKRDLELIERGLTGQPYLAGERWGLADAFVAPAVAVLANFPHAGAIFERCTNLREWISRLQTRPSAEFLFPPQP